MSFASILATMESSPSELHIEPEVQETSNTAVDATIDVIDGSSELEKNINDIDSVDTGITSAENAVEQIVELQNTVSEKLQSTGSLTDFEQKAVQITYESIMSSLGISSAVLTNESIGYSDRAKNLVATLEEKGQGLMASVMNALKAALDSVLVFIQDLIRNNYLLQRYWNKINEQVRKVKGQTPTKETMSESAKALSAGGYLAKDPKAIDFSIDEMYATAVGMMKASDAGIDMINKLNFKFDKLEDRSLNAVLDLAKVGIPAVKSGEAGKTNRGFGYMTNGRTVVRVKENIFGVSKAFEGIVSNGEMAERIAVATPEQMHAIMGKAETIMKLIKAFDSKRSYIKNAISRITQYLSEDLSFYPSLVNKDVKDFRQNMANIRGMRSVVNAVVSRFPLESFKIAKAFIDYCRNSLKHYNGKTSRTSSEPVASESSISDKDADDRPRPAAGESHTDTERVNPTKTSRDDLIIKLQKKFGTWKDVETGMVYPFRYYQVNNYETSVIPSLEKTRDKFMRWSEEGKRNLEELEAKQDIIREREGSDYSADKDYIEKYQKFSRYMRAAREKADRTQLNIDTLKKFIEEAKNIPE